MDRVRLGRALGYGTRHAARTLAAVAEAAASPDPRRSTEPPRTEQPRRSAEPATAEQPRREQPAAARSRTAGRTAELKRSVWKPLAQFSSVVSLQVSGTFFALLATSFGLALWRTLSSHPAAGTPERTRLWLLIAVTGLFAYFAASNFWKAQRRGKDA